MPFLTVWVTRLFAFSVVAFLIVSSVSSEPSTLPAPYPQSLEQELNTLLASQAHASSDPRLLTKLADLYLDMGNNLYTDPDKRLAAYEEGARLAQRALELQEANVEAHFLYAANLGEAASLQGVTASLLSLEELRTHVARALELQKDHVPSLHMAGMMLEGLPRFMGGNPDAALAYVKRVVALAPAYSEARLNLAKMYVKRKDPDAARHELLAIINMEHPKNPYGWATRDRPEAERLLDSLKPAN
ncbi:MAG: tetratricopeptide repeat protein [Nitrospirae bacterium]|nr:MAG: tetratricopeptide repeat protein [Nitrospirota bacterium]